MWSTRDGIRGLMKKREGAPHPRTRGGHSLGRDGTLTSGLRPAQRETELCVSALALLSGHQCPSGMGPFLGSVPSVALYVLVSVYPRSERAVPGAPISFLTPSLPSFPQLQHYSSSSGGTPAVTSARPAALRDACPLLRGKPRTPRSLWGGTVSGHNCCAIKSAFNVVTKREVLCLGPWGREFCPRALPQNHGSGVPAPALPSLGLGRLHISLW